MKYLPDGAQMKAADKNTIESGTASLILMERAAMACVNVLTGRGYDLSNVLIVCGSGNNGGDGFSIGRILKSMGYETTVFFAGNPEHMTKECVFQSEEFGKCGGKTCKEYPSGEYSIIIDALFGVGLSRDIEGRYAEIITRMNESAAVKFAVDIPSGISADTGCVLGTAFCADVTVTFQAEKRGLLLYPGQEYAGEIVTEDIGIYTRIFEENSDTAYTYDENDYWKLLPDRREDSNKGSYGKLLVIAGSEGMSGAAYLNAKAAYRTGAGLVRIYTHESNRVILQTLLPEAIVSTYETFDKEKLTDLIDWADAVCMGSGLGTGETADRILKTTVQYLSQGNQKKACIIDADGLNLLALYSEYEEYLKHGNYILTPHMKEMSRLLNCPVEDIKKNRFALLEKYVKQKSVTCVLKDSRTLVSAKDKRTYLNLSGNSALAKGGSGDVLAGIIAGFMVQGVLPYDAAVLGVYCHGRCGDLARKDMGSFSVLASELTEYLSEILKEQEGLKYEKLH